MTTRQQWQSQRSKSWGSRKPITSLRMTARPILLEKTRSTTLWSCSGQSLFYGFTPLTEPWEDMATVKPTSATEATLTLEHFRIIMIQYDNMNMNKVATEDMDRNMKVMQDDMNSKLDDMNNQITSKYDDKFSLDNQLDYMKQATS